MCSWKGVMMANVWYITWTPLNYSFCILRQLKDWNGYTFAKNTPQFSTVYAERIVKTGPHGISCTSHYNLFLITNCSWILATHKGTIFEESNLENKEMVLRPSSNWLLNQGSCSICTTLHCCCCSKETSKIIEPRQKVLISS